MTFVNKSGQTRQDEGRKQTVANFVKSLGESSEHCTYLPGEQKRVPSAHPGKIRRRKECSVFHRLQNAGRCAHTTDHQT